MDFSDIVGQCTDFTTGFNWLIGEQGLRLLVAMWSEEMQGAVTIWKNATHFAITETHHGTGEICLAGYGAVENMAFTLPDDAYTAFQK